MDVAIVDYGMGNLFSVQNACSWAGLDARITSTPSDLLDARAVILPGVGAFGAAMETLTERGLPEALHKVAASGRPLWGICLGLQLFMSESHEFGRHQGLGLIAGDVVRLSDGSDKVPHVGWARVSHATRDWADGPMRGLPDGAFMYFVHSYYVRPTDRSVSVTTTRHGESTYCSAVQSQNVFACQFHPERSGREGLMMYSNLAKSIRR